MQSVLVQVGGETRIHTYLLLLATPTRVGARMWAWAGTSDAPSMSRGEAHTTTVQGVPFRLSFQWPRSPGLPRPRPPSPCGCAPPTGYTLHTAPLVGGASSSEEVRDKGTSFEQRRRACTHSFVHSCARALAPLAPLAMATMDELDLASPTDAPPLRFAGPESDERAFVLPQGASRAPQQRPRAPASSAARNSLPA